jgi:NAD(P)-dependent dehydrogenase (short-subunit alcohol dehydrogenase family)
MEAMVEAALARGVGVEPVICDLTDETAVRALGNRIAQEHGTLDILVHAAGTIEFGSVQDAPVAQLERMIATNLWAPYLLTQVMTPLMRTGHGDVVFINSSAGIRPRAGVAAYGATKHGLRGLADALRDELNPSAIRVTSVYAGRTRTPLLESVHRWEGREEPPDCLIEPADIAAMVAAVLLLPRSAEVTDIHVRPARPPDPRSGSTG